MLKVFSVFDSKVGAFMNPLFFRSAGEAARVFETTVNSPDHMFAKHPSDYTLFELGDWDEISGKFTLHLTPISLGLAQQFVKQQMMDVRQASLDASVN